MPPKRTRETSTDTTKLDSRGASTRASKRPRRGEKRPVDRNPELAKRIIDEYGTTVADQLGIANDGSSESLFQQFVAVMIYSTRISHDLALRTLEVLLHDQKLTDVKKMQATTWEERTDYLTKGGYTHYRERTATSLGDMCDKLLEAYDGDLNNLREAAKSNASKERKLLKEFKGIGDVGVNIFLRDVQVVWDENYPHIDGKALTAAQKLNLGSTTEEVATQVDSKEDFARLVGGLVQVEFKKAYSKLESGGLDERMELQEVVL